MRIFRRAAAERFDQPDLPRRGVEQIACAHDARDAHLQIVHTHGELVGEHAVRAPDEKIIAPAPQLRFLRAVVPVDEGNVRIGHFQLFCRVPAHAQARLHFLRRQCPAGAAGLARLAGVRRAGGQPLGAAAVAVIYHSACGQCIQRGGVARRARALAAVLRAGAPALVPVEPEPEQVVGHEVGVVLPAPLRVEILKAEHHRPAARAHVQPRQQKGQYIAQMQPPARAGRKAAADRVIRHWSSLRFHSECIIA